LQSGTVGQADQTIANYTPLSTTVYFDGSRTAQRNIWRLLDIECLARRLPLLVNAFKSLEG